MPDVLDHVPAHALGDGAVLCHLGEDHGLKLLDRHEVVGNVGDFDILRPRFLLGRLLRGLLSDRLCLRLRPGLFRLLYRFRFDGLDNLDLRLTVVGGKNVAGAPGQAEIQPPAAAFDPLSALVPRRLSSAR